MEREGTDAEPSLAPVASAAADRADAERLGAVLALSPEGAGLDELIRLIRFDADPRVRERAAVALAYAEDARAVDALIAATGDPDVRVALAAIETLAWSEDRQARATLESLAGSDDARIASAATRALEAP